jgi:hypothetical protein
MEPSETQVEKAFSDGYGRIIYYVVMDNGLDKKYLKNPELSHSKSKKLPTLEMPATLDEKKQAESNFRRAMMTEDRNRISIEYISNTVREHFIHIPQRNESSATGSQYIVLMPKGSKPVSIRIGNHHILQRNPDIASTRYDIEVVQARFNKGDEKEIIETIEKELNQ